MKIPKIVQCLAILTLFWFSLKPLKGQSQVPEVIPTIPSQTITVETIDLKADAGLEDVHPEHLTRSLTHRHWDEDDWVEEIQQRFVYLWQQFGYYKVRADVDVRRIRKSPEERVYAATVNVTAGRQYRLDEIHFVNAKQFTSDELRSLFAIEQGDIFNVAWIQSGLEGLRQAYGSRGFIKFVAVPNTAFDEPHDRISLTIDIDEGPQFRLSEVKVLGLDAELAEKLMRDSGLKAGDVYRQSAVDEFFTKNRGVLPAGAKAEDQTFRQIDEERLTVNLAFDFRNCNTACN